MLSSTTQKFLRVSASLRISIYLESLIEIPSMVKKEIFLKNPAAPSLNLAYVLFRMGERGGGYPYDCVNAVELPPHEIAGDFRLSAAHFHEKRAGFQARKLFNSPLLIRI